MFTRICSRGTPFAGQLRDAFGGLGRDPRNLGSGATDAGSTAACTLTELIGTQTQYETLVRQMYDYVALRDIAAADNLARTSLDSLSSDVQGTLGTLDRRHQANAEADLAAAAHQGRLLRAGTPIFLMLGLLILGLLALVSRETGERSRSRRCTTRSPGCRTAPCSWTGPRRPRSGALGASPVVLVLDLDQFKEVNDTLGHHFGDELLVELADRLAAVMRPSDTIARFGGDEFAVLLVSGGRAGGARVAERITTALEQPFDLDGVSVGIEASIGMRTGRGSTGVREVIGARRRCDDRRAARRA